MKYDARKEEARLQKGTYVDLHTHSAYSDGLDNPACIVRNSRALGIEAMALTDHDSMAGIAAAIDEASHWGMRIIPGAEITTEKYHILGLNVDRYNQAFNTFLSASRQYQRDRCVARCELMAKAGVPITIDKVAAAFPLSRLGKMNIVFTMLADEECRRYVDKHHPGASCDELLTCYLRKGGVAGKLPKLPVSGEEETIDAIHAAGGVAILAHPVKDIRWTNFAFDNKCKELERLMAYGIDGLEIQPGQGFEDPTPLLDGYSHVFDYAQDHDLIVTYGSDFHGASYRKRLLGAVKQYTGELWDGQIPDAESPIKCEKLEGPHWYVNKIDLNILCKHQKARHSDTAKPSQTEKSAGFLVRR